MCTIEITFFSTFSSSSVNIKKSEKNKANTYCNSFVLKQTNPTCKCDPFFYPVICGSVENPDVRMAVAGQLNIEK